MKEYKLVIFDMDGTILYTLDDIVNGLNAALKKNGLPEKDKEAVRKYIGNGIHYEVENSVPAGTSNELIDQVFADFNAYYAIHCGDHTKPYDGVTDLMKKLRERNILTAVVSNKGDYAVQNLDKQYFDGLLDAGVGEKKGIRRKPAPDTVNAVLEQLHVKKEDAVYIGDSEVDIATAKNASMDSIIVEWGYRDHDFLVAKGAQRLVRSVAELERELLGDNA
jgi:haloacid dehalogenase superfamily, subfamily IA, variant 3 with third motif having DD or ED/haloacid dehalogenase superfamily, subfamily IA, variant 1 with third motif having Dx(3-4)D or Dx(3-4)E